MLNKIIIVLLAVLLLRGLLFNRWSLPFITRVLTTKKQRQYYAYHEAGHALALMLLDCGKDLEQLSLNPSGYSAAQTITKDLQEHITLVQAQNWLICELAGEAAENVLAGTPNKSRLSAMQDKKTARKIAQHIAQHETETSIESLLANARNQARQLMEKNKDKLDLLAQALFDKKTLSAEEAYTATQIKKP